MQDCEKLDLILSNQQKILELLADKSLAKLVTHAESLPDDELPWEDETVIVEAKKGFMDYATETKKPPSRFTTNKAAAAYVREEGLPADWKYSPVTRDMVLALLTKPGVPTAAESIGLELGQLTGALEASNMPHLYGEKWSVAVRRAINGEGTIDPITYPEGWDAEKAYKIARAVKSGEYNLSKIAKSLDTYATLVGRFLQTHGYNAKGEKV